MKRMGRVPFIAVRMFVVGLLATVGIASAVHALELPASATTETNSVSPHMDARLLIDAERSRVGVLFDLAPEWHLYWKNPGDTGLPPEIEFWLEGQEEATAAPTRWPAPVRFDGLGTGLASYGYAEQVLLAAPAPGLSEASEVVVDIDVLICADECIPVAFQLQRALSADVATSPVERALFDRYEALVPRDAKMIGLGVEASYTRSAIRAGDSFEGAFAVLGCDHAKPDCISSKPTGDSAFIPDLPTDEALDFVFVDVISHPQEASGTLLRFRGEVDPDLEAPLTALSGLLEVVDANGAVEMLAVEVAFPGAQPGAASSEVAPVWNSGGAGTAASASGGTSFLYIVLLALIGGIILNGMPCVLPVLGIKICSAAELAQHDPAELRRHGFAYLAGVLGSMALLAAVVVSLQAAGSSVGWGFQFQEPAFVAVVSAVVVLFALNLFGVYEINLAPSGLSGVGAQTQGTTRSFFDGLLAVALATPCTAPFLGTAVGFAFSGGAQLIFAVFLAIGLGLALPYVLVCLVPGWARFVPRAGNWMLRLRAGLGFLLLATAVWLVWIFGRVTGTDGQTALLAVLVALSFGAWLLGWLQQQGRPASVAIGAAGLVLFGAFAINQIDVQPNSATAAGIENAQDGWQAFDPNQIRVALEDEKPVFVSFTADWCITCKVNEKGALSDTRVVTALTSGGFATFRADYTQRDETIRAELARHGRAGVPLYLVYDPRKPQAPAVLPELLTVDGVLEALAGAAQSGVARVQNVRAVAQSLDSPTKPL